MWPGLVGYSRGIPRFARGRANTVENIWILFLHKSDNAIIALLSPNMRLSRVYRLTCDYCARLSPNIGDYR